MCFDGNPPDVFHAKIVTARKEFKCCECGVVIGRGEKNERAFGVWQGDASTFHTCMRCVEIREEIADMETASGCYGSEAYPPFGELYAAMSDDYRY